jgi:hypothetical protein
MLAQVTEASDVSGEQITGLKQRKNARLIA